jgi:hypothetical protein
MCFVLLQVRTGIVLELPDRKAQVFLVQIGFTRWFSEHAHKMFGEIPMMNEVIFGPILVVIVSHVFLPALIHIFTVIQEFLTQF